MHIFIAIAAAAAIGIVSRNPVFVICRARWTLKTNKEAE